MVSGLFSANTVVHLSTAPATASFEHAIAVCTDMPALNSSTTALIPRCICIISSLISSGTSPISARFPGHRVLAVGALPRSVMNPRRSLDHLVGAGEQRRRHFEAKGSGRLEVDHQLEFGRLHDG